MNGVADGQLAFERQVAAFLGSMAEEVPAGRYTAPRPMIARAHARVAATVVGAILLLAAAGLGGAMIVHALSSVIGSAAPASAVDGSHGAANTGGNLRPGAIAGSNGQGIWGASQSRRYLGASAPGQYTDGLPGDVGPARPGYIAGFGRDRAAEGSRYGRPHGDLGEYGGSQGGQSGYPPPIPGGPSGGIEPPPWIPGSALSGAIASIGTGGLTGPNTSAVLPHHGRKHATVHERRRSRDREPRRDRG